MKQNTLFTLVLIATLGLTQCGKKQLPEKETLKADLVMLAGDSLQGRETGSEGERMAGDYIISRFKTLGLQPKGENGDFRQAFTYKPHPPVQMHENGDSVSMGMAVVKEVEGHNIIGLLDNNKSTYIVIGAHYDHLGWGDENSLHKGDKQIHNGADDNASGVSAMLLLAERLGRRALNHNVLFIAFSGEEKGLWGSNYFCKNSSVPMDSVIAMFNMDMVGRMKTDSTLAVYGTGTSPIWPSALEHSNTDSLKFVFSESGVGPSDHTSFYLVDKPVLHFFTGQHEDYHKPTDDAELINYDGIVLVANLIENLVVEINDDTAIEFTKTKDQDSSDSPAFKVTLGVVPDYLFDGEGMRIDGVSEDRPAHTAGLIKGDVVIFMGDHAVTDMQTYMEGLSMFEKGDSTSVQVKRGEETLSFMVHWD